LRSRLNSTNDSWRVDFDLHPGWGQVDPRAAPGATL